MSGSKKITELTELTTAENADVLPVVDISASETKKITKQNLLKEVNTKADDAQADANTAQSDIDTHESDTTNPHSTTAAQVGADPAGSAGAVQSNLTAHTGDTDNPHGVTKGQVGLGNVDNTTDANKPVSSATQSALDAKADLVEGKVPASQLPSFVDDVVEVANYAALPVTGETGKIYVTLDDNKTYRWSGSAYVEISASIALGETSATAYRGDRGKTAYDHSQATGNPHSTTAADVGAAPALGADDNYVTDAEKTNITTLTNDSMADALHRHSELSAADGSPNPAVFVDNAGNVGIGTTAPGAKLDVELSSAMKALRLDANNYDNGTAVFNIEGIAANASVDYSKAFQFVQQGETFARGAFYGDGAYGIGGGAAARDVYIRRYSANNLMIDSNKAGGAANLLITGSVGIGTTAPTAKLDVNSDIVRVRTAKTPASAGAAGNAGDICWDASYVYVCVATNTWKRSALSTW